MYSLVLTLTVVVANILGAAMALPQATKLIRNRQAQGVSPAWAGTSAMVNGWWVAYGLGAGDTSIVPVSVVSVIAYLAIATALLRYGHTPRTPVLLAMVGSAAGVGLVPVVALLAGGWATAGVALGAMYGIQLSPAVVAVYRSVDVSGVSAATWAMALAEALLFGVWGLAHRDAGLIALAATGSTMSALVLARLGVIADPALFRVRRPGSLARRDSRALLYPTDRRRPSGQLPGCAPELGRRTA